MFIGRSQELNMLDEAYKSAKSELVAIYGRRRIGKSALIDKFSENKANSIHFEALEGGNTKEEIKHFQATLAEESNDKYINNMNFNSWHEIFSFFTDRFIKCDNNRAKLIISFDEIQWMSVQRGHLISVIKFFWDKHWKESNVMLILCGSIASFMVNKVLKSKALYGRLSLELLLGGLAPKEVVEFFATKRCDEEILKYMFVFGGVPKYFEEINMNQSFNQNMNRLCFSRNGLMLHEIDRMFYSQFREAGTYLKIVRLLKDGLFTLKEIGVSLNISSGGSLLSYLQNLENADMIGHVIPFNNSLNSKIKKYTLTDEYLRFYFKFIEANMEMIKSSASSRIFETLSEKQFTVWSGFAFEKFCMRNSNLLGKTMGFADSILRASPYIGKTDSGFQIDLLYLRNDKVITICEIKYLNEPVSTKVIPEVERKTKLLNVPRGYTVEKALVSLYGGDQSVKKSGYFHHDIDLTRILDT